MHTYDIDSTERKNVPFVLAILALPVAFAVHFGTDFAGGDWWWLIDLPAPFGAFLVLYWSFDRWGWRNGWIRRMLRLRTPILHGVWKGTLESSHGAKTYGLEVHIEQSWTRMSICAQGPQSKSSSRTASVLTRQGPHPVLVYTYLNEPEPHAAETMHMHYGTAVAELDPARDALDGHYYTGRDRTTYGAMALIRKGPSHSTGHLAQAPPSG